MLDLIFHAGGLSVAAAGMFFAFVMTLVFTYFLKNKLPKDGGREFAHDGKLSAGKPRGAGIIFVLVFAFAAFVFLPLSWEMSIYIFIIVATMLTGFFDDASPVPWNEYKKGLLDLVLAICVAVSFIYFNGSNVDFISVNKSVYFHPVIFGVLTVILVWVSINVTNCSDGVDGLSGTLTIISLLTLFLVDIIKNKPDNFSYFVLMFVAVLVAYLWFNAAPSSLMMGDAGSRAMGMIIAIAVLKTGSPFVYIPAALIMIIDGGLGLVKVSMKRFLNIKVFWNIRTPIHDHVRKLKGWSNTQTDYRFAILQTVISAGVIFLALI